MPKATIPLLPTACSYEGKITTLHVMNEEGRFHHLHSSNLLSDSYFCSLIVSRPDIVMLAAPAFPGYVREFYDRVERPAIKERGLLVLPTGFGPHDWAVAVEDQLHSCDPGYMPHLVMGNLPEGVSSVSELYARILNAANLLSASNRRTSFQEFQLWPPAS